MKNPALKVNQKSPDSAILIVDKIGVFGEKLAEEFSKDFYVLLVSLRVPLQKNENISFLKFQGKIPKIPHNKYSKMFLIDDGSSITKETSFSFIEEAKNIGSQFYFLGSVRNFDIKHSDELVKAYERVKVLVFGDLFDDRFLFDHDASITKFIIGASNQKKIKVPGEGLTFSYPISFDDTIKLILKASYVNIPQKIILLFYKNPITDISLAHIFQKIDPEIRVDFIHEYIDQKLFIPSGAEYAISKYELKKKIEQLDLDEPRHVVISKNKSKTKKRNFDKLFLTFIIVLIFILFLPALTTFTLEALAKRQLGEAINKMQNNEFQQAFKNANNAESFYNISKNSGMLLSKELGLVNQQKKIIEFESEIEMGINTSNALQSMIEGVINLEEVTSGKSINSKEDFIKGLKMLEEAYSQIQKINLENNIHNKSYVFINDQLALVQLLTQTSDVLPDVLGFDDEKTYIVLFQDNNELRPGGGKITTVGRINLKDARIISFDALDTREFDEKLDVQVEPPFAIRRYLPSAELQLSDSNFNPDFVESAIAASAIYELEKNEEIDGIIGVDLYFLEYFLKELGPVYVDEYGKNITHENIHQVSAEQNEREGESFTTKLIKKIATDLDRGKKISTLNLIELFRTAVSEKHMMFALRNPEIQNVFTTNNFSGSLIDNRSKGQNRVNDFFGLSEANLGDSKINFFVSRSIAKKNIIEENGDMSSEVIIAFKNNSQRGSSFAKSYKNYIQIILPEGARLQGVSTGGRSHEIIPAITNSQVYEDSRFVDPEELEVEQKLQTNKSIFGFLVLVPPDSVETIKLNYSLPFKISTDSDIPTDYSLLIYKQPGVSSFPFNLTFDSGGSFTILPKDTDSLEVLRDEKIDVIISKK